MYEIERDAYAESGPGCLYQLIALAWVLVTVAAFVLGESLRGIVVGFLAPNTSELPRVLSVEGQVWMGGFAPLQILAEFAGGLASGAVIAVGQGLVLFPFLKLAGALEWAAATIIGRGVAWLAIYIVSQAMVRLVLDNQIVGVCMLFLVLGGVGIIAGLALGYAQGVVFRRRVTHPTWWVLANIPGYLATTFLITLTLYIQTENTVRDYTTLIAGGITAISTAVALMEMLRHPTPEAEWKEMFKNRAHKERLPNAEKYDTVLGSTLYDRRELDERRERERSSRTQVTERPTKSSGEGEGS
ncbi:MAG TPA: hypothetical protein VJ183_02270 [Chloroflexia bacterium]|nr:hypothetical protein [Chloroflexia bacterium]